MRIGKPTGWWLGLALCAVGAAPASELHFDPAKSRFGFELSTRWGQALTGRFPSFDGKVIKLADGREQVQLRMYTRDVEIEGHPRYSQWARGPRFFGADKWPAVVFTSKPYDPKTVIDGGKLHGQLNIRGISRDETLTIQPAACARAGLDCDVVVTGAVRRSDYDMGAYGMAVNDRVVFVLRSRLSDTEPKQP